jgi:hypothetical protein
MRPKTFLLIVALTVFPAAAPPGYAEDALPVVWRYSDNNYEIYHPQISADNSLVAFTRKLHAPDGHEAELFSEDELRQFAQRRDINPRMEDPEIVLMHLADKSKRFIDYGWNPVFSRDRTKILYAHQTKPITGYRVLAATLAGNEIREYDMATQTIVTAARPRSGYLSAPISAENGATAFYLSEEVNGAWGGDIGGAMVGAAAEEQKILYAPMREHGLYHLIKQFDLLGDRCFVLRLRPLTEGLYMAKSYAHELVDAATGSLLYSWGDAGPGEVDADFRLCPSGPEVYDDDGWRPLAAGNGAGTRHTGERRRGFSSPNCAYEATLADYESPEVVVSPADRSAARRWRAPEDADIKWLSWSPDASRIALVVSHSTGAFGKFKFDELVVLKVDDLSADR